MYVKLRLAPVFALALALVSFWPATAHAQHRRGGHVGRIVVAGGYYSPFYDAWSQYPYPYPFPPYPYGYRAYSHDGSLRLTVTPKEAEVYVDGYYAGVVDDFDGVFQRLHLRPGAHRIELHHDGYRNVTEDLYLEADSTRRLRYTMVPLAAGAPPEPRPEPAASLEPPDVYPPDVYPPDRQPLEPPQPRAPRVPRMPPQPRMPQPPSGPAPQSAPERSSFGTLSVRVQPSEAEVFIDGERWRGPGSDERLIVQVSEGPHRVEVRKDGYDPYSTEVHVRRGETVPLNVSLPSRRQN